MSTVCADRNDRASSGSGTEGPGAISTSSPTASGRNGSADALRADRRRHAHPGVPRGLALEFTQVPGDVAQTVFDASLAVSGFNHVCLEVESVDAP
ncbi:hypothetical protein [Cryptosporangium japonicum]|uniref:hypothetical protein n=1 Tax=Cryptosporangium japonicum TaxID=80872 RepID=UPI0031E0EC85